MLDYDGYLDNGESDKTNLADLCNLNGPAFEYRDDLNDWKCPRGKEWREERKKVKGEEKSVVNELQESRPLQATHVTSFHTRQSII
jgi:hypothetical protein